jgi:hypothetical protein
MMSDPRVTGTGTLTETITGDLDRGVGLQEATYSLKNAANALMSRAPGPARTPPGGASPIPMTLDKVSRWPKASRSD